MIRRLLATTCLLSSAWLPAMAHAQTERLMSCDAGLGTEGPFVRDCREEAAGLDISDPEFNGDEFLTTWASNPSATADGKARGDGEVFVARVNPITGEIRAETTQSVRGFVAPRRSVRNGPEWANSERGWEIYYSCITANRNNVQICKIERDGINLTASIVDDTVGQSMRTPTTNGSDPAPKIYTEHLEGSIATGFESAGFSWLFDGDPTIDVMMDADAKMGHWLPGGRGLLHVQPVQSLLGTTSEIFFYDTLTQTSVSLFDDGRDRFDPQAWEAPELGGDIAFSAMVLNEQTGNRDVETYRRNNLGQWVLWNRIEPVCDDYANAWSPEPFVFQGRSYLSMSGVRGINPQFDPGIIWVSSVDPDRPQEKRLLSNDSCALTDDFERRDPESLIVNNGNSVRIYYLETINDPARVDVAAVPLPASLPLLAAGLAGIAVLRRRKRA